MVSLFLIILNKNNISDYPKLEKKIFDRKMKDKSSFVYIKLWSSFKTSSSYYSTENWRFGVHSGLPSALVYLRCLFSLDFRLSVLFNLIGWYVAIHQTSVILTLSLERPWQKKERERETYIEFISRNLISYFSC